MLAGQVMVGGAQSLIVTEKLQWAVWPVPSVAVQETVVAPLGNWEPEAGAHTTVAPGAVAAKVTALEQLPDSRHLLMSAGQEICGPEQSFTVTVNVQLEWLEAPSVAVQETVVVPFANSEPDAGVHTTEAEPQLSVATGA